MLGVNFNIGPKFFVGAEGRRIWTNEAEFEGTLFGFPARAKTDLSGYTVTGQFGSGSKSSMKLQMHQGCFK